MKKLIALLLALVLCLSLCACGGDSAKAPDVTETQNSPAATEEVKESQPVGTEEKTEEQEQEEPVEEGPRTLRFNEVVRNENLEFAVVYAEFLSGQDNVFGYKDSLPLADDATHGYFRLGLAVKNIGKTTQKVSPEIFGTLDYNEGYIFEVTEREVLSSYWGPSLGINKEPLGLPSLVAALYKIPREVVDNQSAPIAITLNIGSEEYVYHVRPEEDVADAEVDPGSIIEYANKRIDTRDIYECLFWSFREEVREDISETRSMMFNMEVRGKGIPFADEWIERISSHFSELDKIDEERFAELFPEACAELKEIRADHKKLCELMGQFSETMTKEEIESSWLFAAEFQDRIEDYSYFSGNQIQEIFFSLINDYKAEGGT